MASATKEPVRYAVVGLGYISQVAVLPAFKYARENSQLAPELLYFSDCVRKEAAPEPSGQEGLADVRIIDALYESARVGRPIRLEPFQRRQRPTRAQEIKKTAVRKPRLVHAEAPTL